ncbi:MAG TPA: proline dehydrogenase family protein [Ferruginibacter sp.]|nr:proline dehydrogenase family protein [Ferruginibacter sp.]HMP21874.1 proline dehydrogenase family protein [Ferruginibacter sp.]
MHTYKPVSFENTEYAFAYKKNTALKKAKFLFSAMGKPWLLRLGMQLTPTAIRWKIPFVKNIIRHTLFRQFVGGETLEQTKEVAAQLSRFDVQVILDYGVEGGGNGEAAFDHATEEFIRVIHYAATQPNIPFMSIKVTGFARFELLEKIDGLMHQAEGTLMKRYLKATEQLDADEKEEWHRVRVRLLRICEAGYAQNTGVLVDAEETWIQDPVDALTILMMDSFNKEKIVIYNTIQLYRHDRLTFLKACHEAAAERDFILGAKLVRGAYMEKERARAAAHGYPSPIQPDKAACDKDYNEALQYCMERLNRIAIIVASHNEYSNMLAIKILQQNQLPLNHPHVHFSQLYGMSDNITFNLAKAGCAVSKYLPFGPIKDVIPYLMRRAHENSAVAGQTGRELELIKKEIKRRGL